ncbi:MAG: CPBP family intramembrane metalloprotease [Mogibacterium sp.]|nr:CPBP family intramembrane metalloprotease [Mogibacterium sp.]
MKEILTKTHFTNRIIWILLIWFALYEFVDSLLTLFAGGLLKLFIPNRSAGLSFVIEYYTPLLASCIFFILLCMIVRKNRFMLGVIKPSRQSRSMKMLGMGLLLGFLTNFFCILCALIHGDIKLYLDFSVSQIPLMIFALISVFFQSTSEELWCRCYLYERISVHYPLWVAIVINGSIFGLMHLSNPGISALAVADLIICGLTYSLLCWYSGSIWTCFGIHTMWNFTQNFLFGLPNSGLVSEASVFHLDAATGISNWIYSYEFGVEGGVPAVFIDLLLAVVIIILAKRDGRLGELFESKESRGEMPVAAPKEEPVVEFPGE